MKHLEKLRTKACDYAEINDPMAYTTEDTTSGAPIKT